MQAPRDWVDRVPVGRQKDTTPLHPVLAWFPAHSRCLHSGWWMNHVDLPRVTHATSPHVSQLQLRKLDTVVIEPLDDLAFIVTRTSTSLVWLMAPALGLTSIVANMLGHAWTLLVDLSCAVSTSPVNLAATLGVCQWFDLLVLVSVERFYSARGRPQRMFQMFLVLASVLPQLVPMKFGVWRGCEQRATDVSKLVFHPTENSVRSRAGSKQSPLLDQSKRLFDLLDARAFLEGFAKGRSSAPISGMLQEMQLSNWQVWIFRLRISHKLDSIVTL